MAQPWISMYTPWISKEFPRGITGHPLMMHELLMDMYTYFIGMGWHVSLIGGSSTATFCKLGQSNIIITGCRYHFDIFWVDPKSICGHVRNLLDRLWIVSIAEITTRQKIDFWPAAEHVPQRVFSHKVSGGLDKGPDGDGGSPCCQSSVANLMLFTWLRDTYLQEHSVMSTIVL